MRRETKEATMEDRLNETEVDRELEEISSRFLTGQQSQDDWVKYQQLLAWRRSNLFKVPRNKFKRSPTRSMAS
ncbi:hypothetical protein ATO8_09778 [Roseivivax marinus]|uniref:Uncharacterized protein n=1 Tax=Roseivivax marinus TaxID=1379903 RepID=W4HK74_9RHOB|nr:hypothetical protein ATO8_09778 [Roseivivax marinus]